MVTFGNHDIETDLPPKAALEYLKTLPNNLTFDDKIAKEGVGNCYLPIYNQAGNQKNWMLYFFDSHAYPQNKNNGSYDWIKGSQIEWYRSIRNIVTEELGQVPPSLAFFHIPTPEYSFAKKTIGTNDEAVCSPAVNSGLIAAFLEKNDVLATFVGHDHNNDFIANYLNQINLIYGRKTGYNSAYKETLARGGRLIIAYENSEKFETYNRTLDKTEHPYIYEKSKPNQ